MRNSLSAFIAHARSKNMDHQTIRLLLLSAGWKEKDIGTALATETLDLPVPIPADVGSARDAFFYLLSFTALYATVISLIVLAYQFIQRMFPDPALYNAYDNFSDTSSIRWPLAVVLLSYPLFLWLSRTLHKEMSAHPEKLASGIRRWLTYLTLFITACTMIGDLITLLFYLLQGELTIRFILKVIAIFVLSGLPFLYYTRSMRLDHTSYAKSPLHKRYLILSAVITLIAVAWALFTVGSPAQGRIEKFDEQRIADFRTIQNEMISYLYGSTMPTPETTPRLPKPLPTSLLELSKNVSYQKIRTTDPETKTSYEYIPQKESYELCAFFNLTRDQSYDVFWNHSAGRTCFTIDALERSVR